MALGTDEDLLDGGDVHRFLVVVARLFEGRATMAAFVMGATDSLRMSSTSA